MLQTNNAPAILQIMRSLFSERTFTFKEIIESHICSPVSVENLAQLTNHSLSSFKREFKRVFQTTPGAYITRRRAEKVAEMLQVSDEPISQIGYACGFSSPGHLSRVFKSQYGQSPTDFRLARSGR